MAIIDIGSNSVKLLLEDSNQKFVTLTRLAQDLDKTNILNDAAIQRTAQTVGLFFLSAQKIGERVLIFGTEAARAAGADKLIKEVYKLTNIKLDIISGQEEAECAFIGSVESVFDSQQPIDGKIAVVDVGGASTEICVGNLLNSKQTVYKISMPVGAVRLFERFGTPHPKLLDKVLEYIYSFLTDSNMPQFSQTVFSGGTSSALTAAILGLDYYDTRLVHKKVITIEDIESILTRLFSMTVDEVVKKYTFLEKARAETFPFGVALFYAIMKRFGIKSAIKSETGVTEGYMKKKKAI